MATLISKWCRNVPLGGRAYNLHVRPEAVFQTPVVSPNIHSYAISIESGELVNKIATNATRYAPDLEQTIRSPLSKLKPVGGILWLHRKTYTPSEATAKRHRIKATSVFLEEEWWLDVFIRELPIGILRIYHDSVGACYFSARPTLKLAETAASNVGTSFVDHDDVILDWHGAAKVTGMGNTSAYLRATLCAAGESRIVFAEYDVQPPAFNRAAKPPYWDDDVRVDPLEFTVVPSGTGFERHPTYSWPHGWSGIWNHVINYAVGDDGRGRRIGTLTTQKDKIAQIIIYNPVEPFYSTAQLGASHFSVNGFEFLTVKRLVTYAGALWRGTGRFSFPSDNWSDQWPGTTVSPPIQPKFIDNPDVDFYARAAVQHSQYAANYLGSGFFQFKSKDLVSKLAANTGEWGSGPGIVIVLDGAGSKAAPGGAAGVIGFGLKKGGQYWLDQVTDASVEHCRDQSSSVAQCRFCLATSQYAAAASLELTGDAAIGAAGMATALAALASTGVGAIVLAVAAAGYAGYLIWEDLQDVSRTIDKCNGLYT